MQTIAELYPYHHLHPDDYTCRKCGDPVTFGSEIMLCNSCKSDIKEEAEWIKFQEEQKEFWNKFNKGE